jgi:arsenate reductase (glutaredoxin)
METIIYHNPRCSKSRATLELIKGEGVEPVIQTYLDTPPSKSDITKILQLLNRKPQEIMRFGESVAKELGLSPQDDRSEEEWIDLMLQNPILIERPIVVVDGEAAVIGRPPESVLAIL